MHHRPLAILLAEDNEDHAALAIEALRSENAQNAITHVANGQEAIDFLAAAAGGRLPDLVLLDIKMPLKTGFDVLHFIKGSRHLLHIPTVMISTTSNGKETQKAYDMGANSFLTKPVGMGEFLGVIKTLAFNWTT